MYMISLTIHLYQPSFEFLADTGKEIAQRIQGGAVEDHATIFGHED
jgi:hypothetical protein